MDGGSLGTVRRGPRPCAEIRQRNVERLDDQRRTQARRDWIKGLGAARAQNGNSA